MCPFKCVLCGRGAHVKLRGSPLCANCAEVVGR